VFIGSTIVFAKSTERFRLNRVSGFHSILMFQFPRHLASQGEQLRVLGE